TLDKNACPSPLALLNDLKPQTLTQILQGYPSSSSTLLTLTVVCNSRLTRLTANVWWRWTVVHIAIVG
ncbi:hypothetical protein S83_031470, partial [Arachis hypogaea]